MNNNDLIKLLIALTSAFSGWILAQLAASLRTYFHRQKVKRLLLEELSDVEIESDRLLQHYARKLQLFGAKGLDSGGQVMLANPIFDNYYKDAVLALRQSQRLSFQMIDGLINACNQLTRDFDSLTDTLRKLSRSDDNAHEFSQGYEQWGELAKGGYVNAAIIKWHAQYHRSNADDPTLYSGDRTHQVYLQYVESVIATADKFIDTGKEIPLEKFGQAYDECAFQAHL